MSKLDFLRKYLRLHAKKAFRFIAMMPHRRNDTLAREFENFLSIIAIAKNEGAYFKEWIDFHLAVGIEKFYIYDNESSDNTREILQPYIDRGIVVYHDFPGPKMQRPAYQHAIKNYKYKTRWMALLDLDEFLVPATANSVPAVIKDIAGDNKHISQILIGWRIYGSSGHREKPNGMVIENYLHHEKPHNGKYWHKAIFNPRRVYIVECHCCGVFGKTIDENGAPIPMPHNVDVFTVPESCYISTNKIRINHYAVKSWDEWIAKKYKGDAWKKRGQIKSDAYFTQYDQNDIFDDAMQKWVDLIRDEQ
ncbi:MAG: glycosyltransferase family 92 protein [Alphaproteobacteria bacterium]|nr:glycosyltransferase family 92 protein [Alphaproteobacteria bacterium]MCL2890010.1 glycosyltransferase family 92 protein [Alphaproteobacteria bacterium]